MTILRTDTISGIGTEGTVFEGDITFDSLNYMTLPKGTTDQRYSLEGRDPHYHKLKLHLPFVHHTQFDDYSPTSPSITANYETHISSKSGVFENSAALFSRQAANDWLAISDSTDLDLGTDDFTIECWFMCAGGGTDGILIQKGYSSGTWSYYIQFKEATDSINFYATSDGTNFDIVNGTSFGTTILPNIWYHVAVCRSGNTFSYYIDGKKGSTTDTSSASLYNSSIEMRIKEPSGFGATEDVFFQDVRLYKGVAKYSESFTPQKLAEVGAIRHNTDSNKIECYDGTKWMQVAVSSPDLNGGARGIFAGGYTGGPATLYNIIEYITIPSAGNAIDFGNLTSSRSAPSGTASSRTRGLVFGGYISPNDTDAIDYITISSTGNALDFGNMLGADRYANAGSNQTRAVQMGGYDGGSPFTNVMQYVTIATTGNAVDFGDLVTASGITLNTCTSPTISVLGGYTGPSNTIEYITIHTLGNAADFGDLTNNTNQNCGSNISSSTRGVFFPGGPSSIDSIDYITMASKGNAVEYGDTDGMAGGSGRANCASTTRAVTSGGGSHPAYSNQIAYIAIATGGTAVDFGDTTQARGYGGGLSNGHGGL